MLFVSLKNGIYGDPISGDSALSPEHSEKVATIIDWPKYERLVYEPLVY